MRVATVAAVAVLAAVGIMTLARGIIPEVKPAATLTVAELEPEYVIEYVVGSVEPAGYVY